MAIVRFDPFQEFARMNRVFGNLYRQDDVMRRGAWVPAVDIFEDGDRELVLKAELPDMKREDINITVDNGTLVLSGEKKLDSNIKEENFHRTERSYGAFSRSFA